jgi:hypothetical protein
MFWIRRRIAVRLIHWAITSDPPFVLALCRGLVEDEMPATETYDLIDELHAHKGYMDRIARIARNQ